jgi:hypothetical protein
LRLGTYASFVLTVNTNCYVTLLHIPEGLLTRKDEINEIEKS